MTQVRIEYGVLSAGGNFQQIGAAVTMAVTGTATAGGARPTVPAGVSIARLTAIDGDVIASAAADPTASSSEGQVIARGLPERIPVSAGQLISFLDGPAADLATSLTFFTARTTNGAVAVDWPGGRGLVDLAGVMGGATVQLAYSSDGGVTYEDTDGGLFTTVGTLSPVEYAAGKVRATVAGAGGSTSLTLKILRTQGD